MVFYKFHNGKRYYYFNGVLKRFRERVDKNITKDELISVLKRIDFPIMDVVEIKDGMKKVVGYYNVDLIEEWINSRKGSLLDKLREKREYDSGKYLQYFKQKPKLPIYDNRTQEEIEREYEEKRKMEMEKRTAEILKRMEEIDRQNPEEDMEKVSDELLKQDDVYYESVCESSEFVNKLNESVSMELPVDTSSLPKPLKKSEIIKTFKPQIEKIFNDYVGEDKVDTATKYIYGTRLKSGTPLRFSAQRKVDMGTMMRAGAVDWRSNYGGKNYWILKTTILRIKNIFSDKITFEEVAVAHEGSTNIRFDSKNDMLVYVKNLIDKQNKKFEESQKNK